MYFERFLGLDDVSVLIFGAPIRFTACDFSCDSAPAAQMWPQCCCMRSLVPRPQNWVNLGEKLGPRAGICAFQSDHSSSAVI